MKDALLLGLAALAALCAQPAAAQMTEYELTQVAAERRTLMFDIQDIYFVLFNLNRGKTDDFAAGAEAAGRVPEKIDAFASKLLPGTERGKAPGTRARPEIWTEPEAFAEAVAGLKAAAAVLGEAAASGDTETFKAHFDDLTDACAACHGFRPSSGGRFRYDRED